MHLVQGKQLKLLDVHPFVGIGSGEKRKKGKAVSGSKALIKLRILKTWLVAGKRNHLVLQLTFQEKLQRNLLISMTLKA